MPIKRKRLTILPICKILKIRNMTTPDEIKIDRLVFKKIFEVVKRHAQRIIKNKATMIGLLESVKKNIKARISQKIRASMIL